jgi:hypothetical protein
MNENQKKFLTELCELLDKYSIELVTVSESYDKVVFYSNGNELSFATFANGKFTSVRSETTEFIPQNKEE